MKHPICLSWLLLLAPTAAGQLPDPRWRPEPTLTDRSHSAVAYDSNRGWILLFGGDDSGGLGEGLGDTWVWRDRQWTEIQAIVAPSPRLGHAMAHDPWADIVLLHGGRDVTYRRNRSDTWMWDGAVWQMVDDGLSGGPGGRSDHAMAFDPVSGKILLFGGWSRNSLGVKGDTWAWDSSTGSWTQLLPVSSPAARMGHRMILDERNQQIVLYGGRDAINGSEFQDTWVWTGSTWVQRNPAFPPPAQSDHAMAYDFARGVTVLHGARSETWEWDGFNWSKPPAGPAFPSVERGHVMAFDSREVLLFGGGSGSTGLKRGTWLFDGAGWSEVTRTPPSRAYAGMAYDPVTMRTVVFGGAILSPYLNDTWEWDGERWYEYETAVQPPPDKYFNKLVYRRASGTCVLFTGEETWEWDSRSKTWTRLNPATSPPPRRYHALAYEAQRDRVLLFGGEDRSNASIDFGDTWEWDGTNWTQLQPATSPPPRIFHSMSYDLHRRRVVMVGGTDASHTAMPETWEWDGADWQRMPASPTAPAVYTGAALAYHVERRRTVLCGGGPGIDLGLSSDETWEWDGASWLRTGRLLPDPREYAGMSYDSARQRMVLFGGIVASPVSLDAVDPLVWSYFSNRHDISPFPVALGGTLSLHLEDPSLASQPYLVVLSMGRVSTFPVALDPLVGSLVLPLALDPLFYVTLGQMSGVLDPAGRATRTFPIPQQSLIGARSYYSAGIILAPPAIGAITNDSIISVN